MGMDALGTAIQGAGFTRIDRRGEMCKNTPWDCRAFKRISKIDREHYFEIYIMLSRDALPYRCSIYITYTHSNDILWNSFDTVVCGESGRFIQELESSLVEYIKHMGLYFQWLIAENSPQSIASSPDMEHDGLDEISSMRLYPPESTRKHYFHTAD